MEVTKPIKVGNVWTNLISGASGESVNFEEVSTWYDGTPMDDSKADGVVYRKLPNGGGYVRRVIPDNMLNVLWFGAVGDGNTDSTSPLVNCFTLANTLNMGINIPSGVFLSTQPLTLSTSGVTLTGGGTLSASGVGTDSSFIQITGNDNEIAGIKITGTSRVGQYLVISGDRNTVKGCKIWAPNKLTSETLNYNYHCIRILGNNNTIDSCELYNQSAGVNVRFKGNVVRNCYIHDGQQGIYLSASCRDTLITGNHIANNDATHDDGCDGIYAQRNVSRITISNNTISNSGEHGIYFQGDSSVIEGNNIYGCAGSGIKLASYDTGLYWYDDETPLVPYIGYENKVSNNVCKNNTTLAGSTGGGIYLQAPLTGIVVDGNICTNNSYNIRTALVSQDLTLDNISIINNLCSAAVNTDILSHTRNGSVISRNTMGTLSVSGDATYRVSLIVIEGNTIAGSSTLSNVNDGQILNNKFNTSRPNIINNCNRMVIVGNTITSGAADIELRRVRVFSKNDVTFSGKFTNPNNISALEEFKDNIITHTNADLPATEYVFQPSSNITTNGLIMTGNKFTQASVVARTARFYGTGIVFSNNTTNSTDSRAFDFFSSSGVITGNVGNIAFQSGSSGNTVSGNIGSISGGVSDQKVDTVTASADSASAPGATYDQTEVQAILTELRDLKTKMRAAGLLAT